MLLLPLFLLLYHCVMWVDIGWMLFFLIKFSLGKINIFIVVSQAFLSWVITIPSNLFHVGASW